MNHKDIQKNNYIEKYLLHQLNNDEVDIFEEHLLYCETCRENLVKIENLADAVELSAKQDNSNKIDNNTSQEFSIKNDNLLLHRFRNRLKKNKSVFINAAAILIIITSFYFIKSFIWIDNDSSISVETKLKPNQDKTENHTIFNKEKYKTNPILESFIYDNVRSNIVITVSFPKINDEFNIEKDEFVKLKFKGKIESISDRQLNNHIIKIFSNDESDYINDSSIINFPLKLSKNKNDYIQHFSLEHTVKLPKGLYYFSIEMISNDDPLYIGKFFVK